MKGKERKNEQRKRNSSLKIADNIPFHLRLFLPLHFLHKSCERTTNVYELVAGRKRRCENDPQIRH